MGKHITVEGKTTEIQDSLRLRLITSQTITSLIKFFLEEEDNKVKKGFKKEGKEVLDFRDLCLEFSLISNTDFKEAFSLCKNFLITTGESLEQDKSAKIKSSEELEKSLSSDFYFKKLPSVVKRYFVDMLWYCYDKRELLIEFRDGDKYLFSMYSDNLIEIEGRKYTVKKCYEEYQLYDSKTNILSDRISKKIIDKLTNKEALSEELYKSLSGHYVQAYKKTSQENIELRNNALNLEQELKKRDIVINNTTVEVEKLESDLKTSSDKLKEKETRFVETFSKVEGQYRKKYEELSLVLIEEQIKTLKEKDDRIIFLEKKYQKTKSLEFKISKLEKRFARVELNQSQIGVLNSNFTAYTVKALSLLDDKFFPNDMTRLSYEQELLKNLNQIGKDIKEICLYKISEIVKDDDLMKNLNSFIKRINKNIESLKKICEIIEDFPSKVKEDKPVNLSKLIEKMKNFAIERKKL